MMRGNLLPRGAARRMGAGARAALAAVVAFSLAFPAPALAAAGDGVAAGVPAGGALVVEAAPAWNGDIDTAWYSAAPTASEFTISTAEELAGLAAIVNGTAGSIVRDDFSGKTVKLAADVKLNDTSTDAQDDDQEKWTPIGNRPLVGVHNVSQPLFGTPNAFAGTFDGQGHVVENIYACTAGETNKWGVNDYGGYQGLFGALGAGAVVKNLGLEGGFVTGRVAGGIAALGVASSVEDKPMVLNCYNTATVEGNGSSSRGAGGIFGGEGSASGSEGDFSSCYIANCRNAGEVRGKSNNRSAPLGGIAGQGSVEVYSCYNEGDVATSSGPVRGGIVGVCRDGSVVADCYGLAGVSDSLYNQDDEAVADGLLAAAQLRALIADGKLSAAFTGDGTAFPKLFWEVGPCATTDVSTLAEVGDVADQDYTGSAVKPPVAVTLDGKALKAGSDYRVTYSDNVNVGTATYSIAFLGAYSGSAGGQFEVLGTSLNSATVEVGPQWIYGSDPVEPDIVVKDVTGKTLKADTDYKATFTDNTAPGTGYVLVEPGSNGNYRGSASADFPIVPASTSLRGAGTEASPYLVGSRADLQWLAHEVNDLDGAVTGVYRLTADIDMAGTDALPEVDALDAYYEKVVDGNFYYYEAKNGFAGTLDGAGHTLSMRFDVEENSFGLIGHNFDDTDVTVRDLNLEGSIVAPYTAAALFPSVYGNVTLENVKSAVDVTAGYKAYGLVGEDWGRGELSISGCENAGAVTGGREAAGILGVAHLGSSGVYQVTDTVNSGAVSAGSEDYRGQWAAGIIGSTAQVSSSKELLQLERCANSGAISADAVAGGLVGALGDASASLSTGDASANWHSVIACYNTGDVTAEYAAGGLVGTLRDENRLRLSGVYNTGSVAATGSDSMAGGLVGGIGNGGWYLDVAGAYNAGAVTSATADGAGALLGYAGVGSMYYPAGAEISLSGAHYLAGSAASWAGSLAEDETEGYFPRKGPKVSGEAEAWSQAAMKAVGVDGLAARLGTQFTHDVGGVNQGYPVLFWQVGDVVVVDISGGTPSAIADCEYTGRPIAPTGITVALADGTVLVQGVDFIATFSDNTEVGAAHVTLTGIGRCVGTVEAGFNIVKADVSKFAIDDIGPQWGSNASPAMPSVTVRDASGRAIGLASGFTVSFEGNEAAGQARVTVSADSDNGSYFGSVSGQFTVHLLADDVAGGSGTVADPYLLSSAAELERAARGIKSGALAADGHYRLANSFSVPPGVAMTALGTASHPFAGTFDGAGETITRKDTAPSGWALLHDVDGAQVKRLTIAGTVRARHLYDSRESQVDDGGTFAGAIEGDVTFSDCRNEARVVADDVQGASLEGLGGFVARVGADCEVSFVRCVNAGDVANRCAASEDAGAGTGGFVGCFDSQTLAETDPSWLTFEKCVNSGRVSVSSGSYAGGFVGRLHSDGYDANAVVRVEGCVNTGAVSAPRGSSQAGIVGGGTSGGDSDDPGANAVRLELESVGNRGGVSGFDGSAGLFGVGSGVSVEARYVYNTGAVGISTDIESGSQMAGGLFTVVTGSSTAAAALDVEGAYNAGVLASSDTSETADPMLGGVAAGLVSGDDYSFENVFYTIEGADRGVGNAEVGDGGYAADLDGIAPVFESDLRAPAFLGELGGGFTADDDNENRGLPVCGAAKVDIAGCYATFADADPLAPQALSVAYTGKALAPAVVVSPDSTGLSGTLSEGVDYLVYYADNVQVGTATANVVGMGAYSGTLSLPFSIVGKGSVADCSVSAIPEQVYTGGAIEPAFTVSAPAGAGGGVLARGTDYTVTFLNNVGEGTAAAVIKGIGAWTGVKVVKFSIWKPYLTVKLRTGNGAVAVAKRYKRDEFEALGGAGDAVSALYRAGAGASWHVATASSYVTLDALLADAGVPWKAGVSATCAGAGGAAATLTYSDLHGRYFYAGASAGAANAAAGGRAVPAVLAIEGASSAIGGVAADAAAAEALNLAGATDEGMPRFLFGVTPQEAASGSAPEGRLVAGVSEVTVTVLDYSALGSAITAATGAESGIAVSRDGSDVLVGGKWVTPAAKASLDQAIAAAKSVRSSATAVQADIDSATASLKRAQSSFKPAAGTKRLVNTLSVKVKKPSVKRSKKKAKVIAAKKAFTVSGAQGSVTFERVAKGSSKWLSVNSKTGAITVKKRAPKKKLSVKVNIHASGNAVYAPATQTVTVKVKVK